MGRPAPAEASESGRDTVVVLVVECGTQEQGMEKVLHAKKLGDDMCMHAYLVWPVCSHAVMASLRAVQCGHAAGIDIAAARLHASAA